MTPLTDRGKLEECLALVRQAIADEAHGDQTLSTDFDVQWIRERGWKVVPVESAARLPDDDIPRLVNVLGEAGSHGCLVVATEDLGPLPRCYVVSLCESDIRELNRTLGLFRFLLVDTAGQWAISCTEWYNLFAARADLLARMLGGSIDEARGTFHRFASEAGGGRLLAVAQRYAAI
jgi:hypothetical protein